MGRIIKSIKDNIELSSLKEMSLNGENVNECDKIGRTPLIYATIDNKLDLVRMLINNGADVNIFDKLGFTPLHYAAQNYCLEIAKVLISNFANVDAKDIHGNTPLFKAVFNSQGRGEIIELLRTNGADKDLTNNYGVSPYQLAQNIANFNVIQFMD